MITMYRRTIGYSKICSSIQDHIIKIWLRSQHFGPEDQRFEHRREMMIPKRSYDVKALI